MNSIHKFSQTPMKLPTVQEVYNFTFLLIYFIRDLKRIVLPHKINPFDFVIYYYYAYFLFI